MAELTLDSITKVFDDGGDEIVAVDGIDIDIADGEFLVLVGPSGCGKSTTLRMIAGLESVTDGSISLGDNVVNDVKPRDRDIAMVFQSYALYPHMTVRENMAFGLEQSTELSEDERNDVVEDTCELLGIRELIDRKPGELSGGQQQRVALGRAIVREPAVFLMDEPLSNLDAKLRSSMRTELQRLQEDLDTTTVYVTHDQTEAMTMGDRIAILDDGELQQVATPLEAYHRPANRFVAGFIGDPSMNFFGATVDGDTLDVGAFEYTLSERTLDDLGDATEVTLGIRPEDVELVDAADGLHDFPVTVDVVEPMGNENNVYLDLDEDTSFVGVVSGQRIVREGGGAAARIPEDAIHLFDRRTGEALHNRVLDEETAEGLAQY